MDGGTFTRSVLYISKSELYRQVTAYWTFVISLVLVLDALVLPLLQASVKASIAYMAARVAILVLLSWDLVASYISTYLRINLDAMKVLESWDNKEFERLCTALTYFGIAFAAVALAVAVYVSSLSKALALEMLMLSILSLSIGLLAILIKPKCLGFITSISASLAIVYVLLMPFVYGEIDVPMMSLAMVCSDAFAILGMNLAGVTTCLDATK